MEDIRGWFRERFSDPQIVALAVVVAAVGFLIWEFGGMLAPMFASVVIAYLLEGPTRMLERRRMPRLLAVVAVFSLFMFFLLFVLFWLLPLISNQIAQLVNQTPAMIARGQDELLSLPDRYPRFFTEEQVRDWMNVLRSEFVTVGQRVVSISLASLRGLVTILMYMVLMPLLVFFFMKDKTAILRWAEGFLPEKRELAVEVWRDVDRQIGAYLRGKMWEILIVWAATYVALSLTGLDFAMLLALATGLSTLIPYVGAIAVTVPVLFLGYAQFGWGTQYLTMAGVYGLIHLLDANILVTLLLSGAVKIHPVAVIAAVLIFGGLLGFWGLFFAIPLATLVRALLRAIQRQARDKRGQAAQPRETAGA